MKLSGALAFLILLWLTAVGASVLADEPPAETGKEDSAVSPVLQQFIDKRESTAGQRSPKPASDAVTRGQYADSGATTKDAPGAESPAATETTDDPVRFDSSGNVQVYIHLENTDVETLQQLRDLGATLEVTNSGLNVVQAWVPISSLDQIAALDAVQEITPPDYGVTKTGSINTEGDAIHRADLVRAFSGLTGAGVKVGVISDGVDSWTTSRSRGDLPGNIEMNPENEGEGDEGTALLEIVHDLAPNARLAFSGAGTSLLFVEATLWLANEAFGGEGADVIVDDLGYYLQPYYEDGYVALAVADTVAGGAVFVSAAGNYAQRHYEGEFVDGGDGYHDFDHSGGTDIALRIDTGDDGTSVILQWNDRFGASTNDYDLYVCPPGLKPVKFNLQNDICTGSNWSQQEGGNDDPYEFVFPSFDGHTEADVYIRKHSGVTKSLELFVPGGRILEHRVEEGGIVGHPAVAEVLAVGAIRASDPGNDDPESFSDRGPSVLIDETRNKPDVMGINGVSITGSGGFGEQYVGVSGAAFFGTSAAAPHVAGIAALIMEAQRRATPNATKKQVADAVTQKLRDTAIDLGESGRDNTFGYGRADALAAIESIAESSTTFSVDSLDPFPVTYTVNSTGDGADSSTSDGVCDDGTVPGSTYCTLRAAIQQANAGSGAVIKFDISGGSYTIQPDTTLPTITKPVFIDGYSQPAASATNLLIELIGTNAGTNTSGLTLSGKGSYVRGLAVNRFNGNGIVLQGRGGGQVLVGNRIGTDTAGATDQGNGAAGVHIDGAPNVVLRDNVISGNTTYGVHISGGRASGAVLYGNMIGTSASGTSDLGNTLAGVYVNGAEETTLRDNVISGNDSHGVSLSGSGATNADIQYNLIGVSASGTSDLGNTMAGIHISGGRNTGIFENVIGGNDSHGISLTGSGTLDTFVGENYIGTNASGMSLGNGGAGVHIANSSYNNFIEVNTIAHNAGDGVTVTASGSFGNTIWENSTHSNGGLGIDLNDDGVTANDSGDTDSGPNFLQNFPTLTAFATRSDAASARFTLDVTANRRYIVDFYANDSCDASGNGEGKQWLGFTPVLPSSSGFGTFNSSTLQRTIGYYSAPAGNHITATATDTLLNTTSEFSACVTRVDLPELVISKNPVVVTEGTTTTYTVSLPSTPSAETKVALSVDDSTVAILSTDVLTFPTGNNNPQTVTVTPVSDNDVDNDATEIRHSVSIGDHDYPTAVLPVEVTDDDAPTLTLTNTTTDPDITAIFPGATVVAVGRFFDGGLRMEEGDAATYTVVLKDEPPADVTVRLTSSDTGAMTVAPPAMTFTSGSTGTWDDPQTATLTAVTDSDAFDEIEQITHEMTIAGKDYTLAQVLAIVRDLGLPRLTFDPDTRTVSVNEGGTAMYSVALASDPGDGATATVSIEASEDITIGNAITVSPGRLSFTGGPSGNWGTGQDVTVTGVEDADEFDNFALIEHTITVGTNTISRPKVLVTVSDENRAPFFEEGLDTTRDVPEYAGAGANVGDPVVATDLNTGDTLTYEMEDTSGLFAIDNDGQITVVADDSLNYEAEADYEIQVTVRDRATDGLTDKIEVKVRVTDVNEPPIITGEAMPTFNENTGITNRVARYTATDPERDSFTWTVDGTDKDAFTIDTSGNLRFNSQPDHEDKNAYRIEIVATDDGDPAAAGKFPVTVSVTNVNEAPEIHLGGASHNYSENDIHPVQQYFARDPEGTTTFSWTLGGTDRGDFTITNGLLEFANIPDYERPADSGGDNVYNVQVRASDGSLTGTKDVTVTVEDLNEAPVISGDDTLSYPENTAVARVLDRYSAADPERGQITWSLSGTDPGAFRIDQSGNLYFAAPPDLDATGTKSVYEISVEATDDGTLGDRTPSTRGAMTGTFDVTVTVTPIDEPPVITGTTILDKWQENDTSPIHTYIAVDPEGNTPITWTLDGTDRGDFNISQDGELTFRNTPNYESPADSNRNNEYLVTVRASDGQYTGMLNVTVTVRDVNEAPMLDGPDTVDDFPENASTSRQVARYTASDPERATVTLSLTGTDSDDFTLASNGVLTFNTSPDYEDQSSYSVTVRAEAGIHTGNSATRKRVTVNLQNVEERGTVTLSAVQPQERTGLTATLDDDDDPTGITWQWYRTSSRGSTGTAITSATFRFYTPVADDVGSYLRAVASYDDGHGTGKTASAVSANRVQAAPPDPEPPVFPVDGNYDRSIRENTRAGTNLGAPVRATDANNDRLTYSIPESDYFEVDASSGQLRTKAELDHEDEDEYTVTVTATDPGGGTGAVTVTITVTDVNEGPEVSGRNSYTVEENQELSGAEFFATDPEGDSVARWSLSGTDGGDFSINETGVLTFRNTPNYESPFDSNRNNEYLVTVRASDGQYTGTLNVTVTVRDVNEAPEFASSSKSRTSFTYPENNTHALYTYQATDPEGRTITWSVSGTDGGDFDISVTGVLTFADVPDFENPVDANRDNEYLVTVQAQDDGFNFDRLEVTVNVTNSAGTEEPTITTTSRPALTFQENGTGAVYSYNANDPQRGIITWSVAGTDARAFTITSDSSGRGVLTFTSPPDFENPTDSNRDNLYEIAVVATDEQGLTDNFDVTVTVANHAESVEPTISTRRPPTTYQENGTATVYNFRASDPQRGPITWSGTGTDASAFALSDSGALSFVSPPDFESPSDLDRQNDYELKVVATDEDGHSDSLAFTITVTDVNEGPEIRRVGSAPGGVAENQDQMQVLARYTATDPEDTGAQITLWSTSGMDGGDFVINEHGELRFRYSPDYERPADSNRDNIYEMTVRASDGRYYGTHDVTVTVTPVNEAPTITTTSSSATGLRQPENRTSRLYTYRATDPEGSSITWSVGGADGRFFTIDERGQFSFSENSPPDFEIPGDSGGDNIYNVTVQASDGTHTESLAVMVNITDVNEGPEISGTQTLSLDENRATEQVLASYTGSDPESPGTPINRWSTSGTDGGDFTINESGELKFRNTPDYERPADSNRDNIYTLSVRAYDGRYYGHLEVTVTVDDLDEISGPSALDRPENFEGLLSTYSATGRGGLTVVPTWRLTGTDGGDFSISEQGELTFRSTPDYERPADSNRDNVYSLAVQVSDGGYYGSRDVTVTVTPVNEAPTITTTSSSATGLRQPENRTSRLYTYRATDPEGSGIAWSVGGADGRFFTIDERGQFSFSETSPPDFEFPGDSGGDNIYNVTVQASDGTHTGSVAVMVNVTDVNEGPTVSGSETLSSTENRATEQVLASYTGSDPESPGTPINRWSTSGTDGGDFTINESGELKFRNTPDYERPADSNRDNIYNFSVRAYDGRYYGYHEVTVTVRDVNEAPTITTTSRTEFSHGENGTSTIYTFRATDPEGGTVTWSAGGPDGGDFTIVGGALRFGTEPDFESPTGTNGNEYQVTVRAEDAQGNPDTLEVTVTVTAVDEGPEVTSGGNSFTVQENQEWTGASFRASDPESGTVSRWSLAGRDGGDFAISETGLMTFRTIPDYERPADSNRDNLYEVTVRPYDGRNYGSHDVTVTVTPVNEPPSITTTGRTSFTQPENRISTLYTFRATDPEGGDFEWDVAGPDASDFSISETGVLTFSSPPDFENPLGTNRNEYQVTVQARDQQSNTSNLPVTVTVTDVNEGPEIRRLGNAPASVPENQDQMQMLARYAATDPEDTGAQITLWSTSGTDGGNFVINEQGELRLRNSPDHERPADSNRDNIYEVTVRASDGRYYGTFAETEMVTVTNVNEAPTITTKSRTEFSQRENATSVLHTYRATDQDRDDVIRWSVEGSDRDDFAIYDGILTFRLLPDYEIPADSNGDNEYEITVVASDSGNLRDTVDATITITEVNEGPEITPTHTNTQLTIQEYTDPTLDPQNQILATYSATDPEGDDVTRWSLSGSDGGDFTISETGALTFRNVPDYDRPADSNRDNEYLVTIRAYDAGNRYGSLDVTVTVTPFNEPPVINTGSRTEFTYSENRTGSIYTYRATDPEQAAISWSVAGVDGSFFSIDNRGTLSFADSLDFEARADFNRDNVYDITVVAEDDRGLEGELKVAVTVTDVNEGPEVSGRRAYTVVEGQELSGATYSATDPEGDDVTRWSLSGSDGGDFEISATGVLAFRDVPDYDKSADSNRDNEYLVTVRAYDAGNRYGSLDVTVTVTDVNEEAPVVTGSDNRTVSENTTSAIYTYRATDADLGDTITWSTSGADGHLFEMNEQGSLSFREAPDYESPRDSGRNNEYQLVVVATDSEGLTGELMVSITVTEVNEGPEITGMPSYTIQEFHQSLANATYSATDPEGDSISSWRLYGSDGGDFTITDTREQTGRNTADLRFRYPPDVDRPADSNRDNEYLVTIRAYDNRGRYGSYDVTVTVTAANEPPVITGSDARTFQENGTGTIHTYRATDPEGDAFTWIAPDGTDGHLFDISDRGVLTFRNPPDFDIEGDADRDNDYQVTVQARDDNFSTGAFEVTVTVTDVNEGPEITRTNTNTQLTVQEYTDPTQDPALQTLATYSARDPEGSDISRWSLSGSDGGDFSINDNGELTFRYAPDYDRPVDSNRDNEYLVSVRAYDETNRYGSLDVTVTVRGENEADPVVTGSQSLSFRENTAVATRLYTYRATDADRDTIIVWSVRGQDGGDFDIDSDDGVLTFKEEPDYEIPADSDTNNEYLVTVVATDDEGREGTLDVVVTVTEVPEGPEITAPSGQTEFTHDENVDRVVATFTARDPEDPTSGIARWSLAGSDAGDLTITDTSQQTGRNTAELTFRNTPDYDSPADSNRDNEYLVTIRAYDQGNRYGSLNVTVMVRDENEAEPVVTGRQSLSFRENTTTDTRLYTYQARDRDRGAMITWSLEGDDRDDFDVDEGVLTFKEEPDYEQPADSGPDNEYEITVVASDGTYRGTLDVTIMVTDVNEGPEITGSTARTVSENFEDIVATYTGEDPEDTTADVTRWSVAGRDGGDFTINENGELTFRNPPDFERPADSNRDNEYEVTVRASDGRYYGTLDVTVTVEAVNEAPEFRSGSRTSFTHRENGTSALYTYRATDPEGNDFTWEVGGTDRGAFEISEDGGVLTFKTPPDFENPDDFDGDNEYLVTVLARDDRSNRAELGVMVAVTDLNEGPEIEETPANTGITVRENSEGVLFDYSATDPENPAAEITRWSATGTDGGDFTINGDGELSFRNVPDFERPADSNRDNEYLVTVRASDGRYYGTLEATVRVEAVNERPEFRGGSTATFTYKENGTSDLYTYRATDPEGNDVAWGLSGTDSGAFEISGTGVLSFIDPPDYESPTDSGSNNVYEVTVEAGDGEGNTAELEVTVTVTNLTDRLPVITGTAQVGRTLRADTSDIAADDGQAKVSYSYQWIRNEGETDTDIDGETDPTYTPSGSDVGKTLKVRVSFSKDAKNAKNQEALTSEPTAAVAAADNRAPTGLPIISGTAQVDQTLTADTSGIADEDGLTNVSYSYQWISGGSDIDGATGSSHTLTTTQQGQTIQVRVSFTDDRNNAETLTSEATGAVAAADNRPATGLPTIGGTAQVQETLTADISGIADEDGLTSVSYSYQWIRGDGNTDTDISGETASTYTLVSADVGKAIKVKVSFTDDANNAETRTSAATAAVAEAPNRTATGLPTISGTAQVGQTLTADTSGIADEDGLTNVSFSYQWIRSDGNTDTDIAGETDSTYTLVSADVGKTIKVKVSFTDDANNAETLTSEATRAVAAKPNTAPTGLPTISGTAQVDETLTADTTGIADADGLDNASYSYQWVRNDGSADADIQDATGSTYTLSDDDVGKTIKVRVSFTDDASNGETLTSAATATVAAAANSPATGAPAISGTAQVEETLTADTSGIADEDGLDDATFAYQWIRNDGNADTEIQDATSSTYSLVYDDVGRTIKVRVSFTDDASHEETLTSAPTEAVTLLVWSATLTAGTRETHSGYNLLHSTGALSQTEFTLGGDDYTVKMVVEGDDGLLSFGLDRRLRTDFTLNVGGVPFSFEDASTTKAGFVHTYQWDKGTVDWSVGDEVELSLTVMGTPATGQPTINGTVQVGETLTADTSGIADADGLDDAVFSYQWIAGGTDIQDATSSTYTLDADDVGKTIKVRMSFTDNADNEETLTSAATATVAAKPNTAPTGLPIISGTVQVGETLMASTSGIADEDGLDNASFSYQWLADDSAITDATGSTYTLVPADQGKTIKVRVSFTDDADNEETLTSAATAAVAAKPNSPATGAPTISGTAQVGKTLTADTSGIADEDGLDNVSYSYQWIRSDGSNDTDIEGEKSSTYTLVPADQGKTIKVKVSFTDDANNVETLTSAATAAVAAADNRAPTGLPTISGTVQVDQTLTADTSGIADEDGLTNVPYSYQWIAGGSDIDGATGSNHTLTTSQQGQTVQVRVSFTDDRNNAETLTSGATATVAAKPNSPATGLPTISGTVQVGETLTASTSDIADQDGLDNATFSYQWLADDSAITDATGSTYTLVPADRGKTIKVKVSFADDANNLETLTSAAMAAVAARPNSPPTGLPTISGTAQVGETLTADTSGIADEDGLDNVSYSYQWIAGAADIDGATGSTYALVPVDVGKAIKVKVSFTDDANNLETLTSGATATVAAKLNRPATGLPTIGGTAQVQETLTADISGIADEDGLTSVSYSYQWIRGDGNTDTDISGETASTYTLVSADVGKAIKVRIIFTDDAGNDESLTSEATAAVTASNTLATGEPTITGTAQVGEELTADTTDISDSDGLINASFTYRWLADDTDITDATGSTYTLAATDEGKAIKVRITFTDDAGNDESLTSEATAAVAAIPNSAATGAPAISGTVQVGQTLTASTSNISDSDGLTNAIFTYQWTANDGTEDTNIQDATGSTYTVGADDEDKTIKVRVSFTDDGGNQETRTSDVTVAVAAAPSPSPLTAAIHDKPESHNWQDAFKFELRFSEDPKEDFSYKTLRDHAFTVTGGEVVGARRLDPGSDTPNIGWEISVKPDSSADVAVELPATTDCEAQGAICTADGTMLSSPLKFTVKGPPLTASFEIVPTSHNGSDNFKFRISFSEELETNFSYKTLRDHVFTVEGGTVDGARRLVSDSNIRWEITVSPDSNGDVTITLPATTDCDAQGALCADGDKKLSSRLDHTVSGPGQ